MSQIIREEIAADEECEHERTQFNQKRKQDFNAMMDGFFSDDSEEILVIETIENAQGKMQKKMSLKKLMRKYTIPTDGKLYKYYTKTLNIEYAHDLVNCFPKQVTQPQQFRSTKVRMLLTRMSKYVMNKVVIGEWDGAKAKEWKELGTTRLSYIYGTSPLLHDALANQSKYVKDKETLLCFENEKTNKVRLIGDSLRYINERFSNGQKAINITFEAMPDSDSHERNAVIVGLAFYNGHNNSESYDNVSISDRCALYRNDTYLSLLSLSNCVMIENNSELILDIAMGTDEAVLRFSHLRYGVLHAYNERELSFDIADGTHLRVYIHQFYGEGTYAIYQMRRRDCDDAKNDENKSKNSNQQKSVSMKKYLRNNHKFKRHNSSQIDRNRKHRKSI